MTSDARRGPLQPGETATIVAVEDGLVLVQPCKATCIANADAAVKVLTLLASLEQEYKY